MEARNHTTYKVTTDISLNETEEKIFKIFKDFVQKNTPNTTIRVAGGWVRDKVLGKESSDIDFALDNMMGEEFVKLAHASLKEEGNARGFGVTKFNPEKSKHLETATIEIMGIWIDVVNLRGESYGSNSRVPEIVIGTPEQDAYRRDLTINSLFYNIHTGKIEDFTERGIKDLEEGIARTPLPPDQTFIDDPLRILRAIRFISRFDLLIDEKMKESLYKSEILEGLPKKVSKERIGTEIRAMLSSSYAARSIELFHQFKLFPFMIEIHQGCEELRQNPDLLLQEFERSFHFFEVFQKFIPKDDGSFALTQTLQKYFKLPDISFLLYMTMILGPFKNYNTLVNPKTKKTEPLVLVLMKDSLKFPTHDSATVAFATSTAQVFQELLKDFVEEKYVLLRTARVIKELKQYSATWEIAFIFALVSDLVSAFQEQELPEEKAQKVLEFYNRFHEYIYEKGLNELFNIKPYIDGSQIQQLFPDAKGPVIQIIKDNAFYWQIENPDKNADDLKNFIAEHRDEFYKSQF